MIYFNFYVAFYKLFGNEVMFLFNDSKKKGYQVERDLCKKPFDESQK